MFERQGQPRVLTIKGVKMTRAQIQAAMSCQKQTLLIECMMQSISQPACPELPGGNPCVLEVIPTGPCGIAYPLSELLEERDQLKTIHGLSQELHVLKDQQIDQLKEEVAMIREREGLKDKMIEMLKKAARL